MKANKIVRTYQNPIYLAREYKRMIDKGQVKNQSDLARKLGVSRVRIHQILNLLKLDSLIVQDLKNLMIHLNQNLLPNTCCDHMLINPLKKKRASQSFKKFF